MPLPYPETEYDCWKTLGLLRKTGEQTTHELADKIHETNSKTLRTLRYLEKMGKVTKTKPGIRGRHPKPSTWKAS